jgi:hypothetical protein
MSNERTGPNEGGELLDEGKEMGVMVWKAGGACGKGWHSTPVFVQILALHPRTSFSFPLPCLSAGSSS